MVSRTRPARCALLVAALVAGPAAAAGDPDVARGIQLVEEGDLDAGIFVLDGAVRRLETASGGHPDLPQAYLYLGIAFVGKGHEAAAKAKFREALKQARDLAVTAERFPPKVIELFEQARAESRREAPAVAAHPATGRKGGRKGLILLGVGGAAAAGVAVAVAGGSAGGGAADTGRTTVTFSNQLTQFKSSEEYGVMVGGSGSLEAVVRWNEDGVVVGIYLAGGQGVLAESLQTGPRESRLTAPVSAGTYKIGVLYGSHGTATYTLTVTHP
jgi:hypothetical protein